MANSIISRDVFHIVTKLPLGTDLNTYTQQGFFTVADPVNSPLNQSGFFVGLILAFDNNMDYEVEILFKLGNEEFYKRNRGKTWSSWKRIIPTELS